MKGLVVFIAFELCLSLWLARFSFLWPQINSISTLEFSYSHYNSDLAILALLRVISLGLLLAWHQSVKRQKNNMPRIVWAICMVSQAYAGLKLLAVSFWAPDDLWPISSDDHADDSDYVGMVYMMASLLTSLVGALVDGHLVSSILEQQKERVRDELTDPLLPEEEGRDQSKSDDSSFTEILMLALPDAGFNLCAFTAGVVAAVATALVPFYTGEVIDHASIEPDQDQFETAIRMMLYAAGCQAIFTGMRGGIFSFTMARFNKRLKTRVFDSLISFEQSFFDSTTTGDITSRLNSDTGAVADKICLTLNVTLRSATQIGVISYFMWLASWRLTTTSFVLIPLVWIISNVYGKIYQNLEKKVRDATADTNAFAQECFSAISTVKIHAAQEETRASFESQLLLWFNLLISQAIAYSFYAAVSSFLPSAVSAVVLGFGGSLVLQGEMSPGDLVSFMLYQQSLSGALSSIGDVVSSFWGALGSAAKILSIMKRKPAMKSGSLTKPILEGQIVLRDIHFQYSTRPTPVLCGLSLSIRPGEVIAIVGPSGGGKSSIIKLLSRLYAPCRGKILLDGSPLEEYDDLWLRRQIALVSQEPTLFARSIHRNIVYGLEGQAICPTQEEVVMASIQANAHQFIEELPQKYETVCGEKGLALSGGQRQRIAIARALVRKPKVLLLDEATSALDTESESIVQDALDHIVAGMQRTTIIVAHRLSTVMNAGR